MEQEGSVGLIFLSPALLATLLASLLAKTDPLRAAVLSAEARQEQRQPPYKQPLFPR